MSQAPLAHGTACPPGGDRPLTAGEVVLVRSVFGDAIDCTGVRIVRRKWFPLQPVGTLMAPMGHIHCHPRYPLYCADYAAASLPLQALFLHEMTHVWQTQRRGRWYLPLMRHPFCRYDYAIRPGWPLVRYGIEQQAEIVRHAFLARAGAPVVGSPSAETLWSILPFRPA
ncbi:MAG: vgr related protein [Novosphingobium sp.]|nr:vgr related protein [Novosphingobium sp.]